MERFTKRPRRAASQRKNQSTLHCDDWVDDCFLRSVCFAAIKFIYLLVMAAALCREWISFHQFFQIDFIPSFLPLLVFNKEKTSGGISLIWFINWFDLLKKEISWLFEWAGNKTYNQSLRRLKWNFNKASSSSINNQLLFLHKFRKKSFHFWLIHLWID